VAGRPRPGGADRAAGAQHQRDAGIGAQPGARLVSIRQTHRDCCSCYLTVRRACTSLNTSRSPCKDLSSARILVPCCCHPPLLIFHGLFGAGSRSAGKPDAAKAAGIYSRLPCRRSRLGAEAAGGDRRPDRPPVPAPSQRAESRRCDSPMTMLSFAVPTGQYTG